MNRAVRRHHKARMRAKARRVAVRVWGYDPAQDHVVENIVRNCDNLKSCSCGMCGNPRRNGWTRAGGKTAKEIQAERDLRDELSTEGASEL